MEYQQQFDGDQDEKEVQETSTRGCPGTLKFLTLSSSKPILFRLDEVDEICRICLNPGTIPIFGGDSDIIPDLKHFAGIDVALDDGLTHILCTQCRELLESAINFRRLAQKSDGFLRKTETVDESQGSQCTSAEIGDQHETDEENSENGVYLEYAETLNESENGSTASDLEESNSNFNDNISVLESIETDPEPKTLFDSFNKNAQSPQCEVCNITFRTTEQLNEHNSIHDPKNIVICEVCKNIIQKNLYSFHLQLHKKSYSQRLKKKYRKIKCTVCGKNVSKFYLKKHMTIHGIDEGESVKLKKCPVCDKHICSNYLTEHIIRKHMQPKVPQGKSSRRIKCPICTLMFSENTYKNHVASHAISRKTYVCEECGKEFRSPSSFNTHKLTHKEVYKYKCQFCPYQGKHLGLLKVHVRTHTKDYAYKCETCNAKFINKSNLSAHERTHSAEVKFVCSECGKCFTKERTLQNHIITIHEGIKDFPCDICGKRYGTRQVMLGHKKRIHNVFSVSQVGKKPSYLLRAQDYDS